MPWKNGASRRRLIVRTGAQGFDDFQRRIGRRRTGGCAQKDGLFSVDHALERRRLVDHIGLRGVRGCVHGWRALPGRAPKRQPTFATGDSGTTDPEAGLASMPATGVRRGYWRVVVRRNCEWRNGAALQRKGVSGRLQQSKGNIKMIRQLCLFLPAAFSKSSLRSRPPPSSPSSRLLDVQRKCTKLVK